MRRVEKHNLLPVMVELDRHLWKDATFRQEHTATLLSDWLGALPSTRYANGAIIGLPSRCQRIDTTLKSLYQVCAALETSFNLSDSWRNIAESQVSSDDRSIASCAASVYDEDDRQSDGIQADTANLDRGLKRKRTESGGSDMVEEMLFDQAQEYGLCIPRHIMRSRAFCQDSQATLRPTVVLPSKDATVKRLRSLSYGDGQPRGTVSHVTNEEAAKGHDQSDLEERESTATLTHLAPTDTSLTGPDQGLNLHITDHETSNNTLSDEMFEDLWPFCLFRLHDPVEFLGDACKTKRKAVSHVITHMIQRHRLTRGNRHAASNHCVKYLAHCDIEQPRLVSGCTRCSRVADWTSRDLVDNASHIGPAICLRCYESFDERKDLWHHLRQSNLCLDKGQILTKSAKSHRLYKTFCSRSEPPSWSPHTALAPDGTGQRVQGIETPEAHCPFGDYSPGLDPGLYPGLHLEGPDLSLGSSNAPTPSGQPGAGNPGQLVAPNSQWMMSSVLHNPDAWAQDDGAGLSELLGDEWAYAPVQPLNLSAGHDDSAAAPSGPHTITEHGHESQQLENTMTCTSAVPWESTNNGYRSLEGLLDLFRD